MIESISEAYITQLIFMMSTIVTYSVQVTIEVTMISSQMSTVEGGFVQEITSESLVLLNQVKTDFDSFSLLLESAKGSTDTAASTTAAAFLQISLQFVILIEQSVQVGFASIAGDISTQITIIQTMSTSVTPFSGKLILLIDGMVTSINIYMVVLEQLIVTLPATVTETEPTVTAVTEPATATEVKPTDVVVTEGPVEKPTEKPTEKPDTTTAPVDCKIYNMDYFSERNTMYNISINNLQDVKASISAAMSGLVVGTVDSSEYMTSLASIVSDLSIDMTNIDADRFSEFMSLSVDGAFSEEQLESLASYEATIDSYISQLAVEIAMGYSFMQDVQMMNGNESMEGDEGEVEEDVESLMEKEEMMMDNIDNLNQ